MRPFLSPRMLGLRLDAGSTIELASRHGFEGVELLVRDLVHSGADLGSIASRKTGLGFPGGTWPLPVDWRGDPDRFRSDLQRLPSYARAASVLGLDRTGTWVPPEILDPHLLNGDDPERAAFAWLVDRLDAVSSVLGDHGHRLGLEAIGVSSFRSGQGRRRIHRIAELRPLINALQSRGRPVGLTVDAFHLFAAGDDISEALLLGPEAIVSVHLSDIPEGISPDLDRIRDDRRALPRDGGTIPCAELLRLLDRSGYSGPVFAEPSPGGGSQFGPRGALDEIDRVVRHAAESLRSIWPGAGRIVRG